MKSQRLDPTYILWMASKGIKLHPLEGPIDLGVVDLVFALNRFGIKTESSCDGHGRYGVNVTFFIEYNTEAKVAALREVLDRLSADGWSLYLSTNTYRFPRKKFDTVLTEARLSHSTSDALPAAQRLADALSSLCALKT